jgi:DNA polymerase III subunit delta
MIFFFYGTNRYAVKKQLSQMQAAYVAKNGSDLGVERIEGSSLDPKRLSDLLLAVPFLANSRLVILDGLSANKPATEKALAMLDQIPDSTVAVFVEAEVDQRTSWYKTLKTKARVVVFEQLEGTKLSAWVASTVKASGGQIERSALVALLTACGSDQWRLTEEITKLVNYDPQITVESISLLVESTVEQSIFELVEAVTAGKTTKATTIYRELIRTRVSEYYILTMLQWQLRNLLSVKSGGSIPAVELAKMLKMSPYVVQKASQQARMLDVEDLESGFLATLDTEVYMKTGRPPVETLEQLIYQLCDLYGG